MTHATTDSAEWRSTIAALQALTLVPLALLLLDLVGVAWSSTVTWTVLGPALVVAFARRGPRVGRWRPLEPGDLLAVVALVVFAATALLEWNVHTDFVFHWGTKAERFTLARGLDLDFLSRPWNEHAHPDYPNGLPVTLAAFAITGGDFRWSAAALLSTVHLGLLLLALRELAARAGAGPVGRAVALGAAAWGVTAFGVGFRQAGGADLPLAAAFAAAAVVLISPADRHADRAVAWIAAFAAVTKLEGMAFAALLLGLHGLRRWSAGERSARRLAALVARTAWPFAVAVAVWAFTVVRHDLFLDTNTGGFDPSRLTVVVPALLRSLATPEWIGLPIVLVALPLLLADRRWCWPATLLLAQGGFYLYVYLSGPVDPEYYVVSTAARLALHLVPTALVLAVVATEALARGGPTESAGPGRGG